MGIILPLRSSIAPCFIVPLLFGVIIVVGLVVSNYTSKKRKEAWRQVADGLKLTFVPGSGFGSSGYIKGDLGDIRLHIDIVSEGSGKSKTYYTRYRVFYNNPTRLGMKLTHQGFFSTVGKFFGAQDIEIGDTEFDSKVIVKGKNPDEIINYLTRQRRYTILQLMQAFPNIVVEDREITVKTQGHESNTDRMRRTIGIMGKHAEKLAVSIEEKPKEPKKQAPAPPSPPESPQLKIVTPSTGKHNNLEQLAEKQDDELSASVEQLKKKEETLEGKFEQDEELLKQMEEKKNKLELELAQGKLDEEIGELVSRPSQESSPVPQQTPDVIASESEPDKNDLSVGSICNFFFQDKLLSSEATNKFKALAKQQVEWNGKLISIQKYFSDFNFKGGSGTKAVFEIFEIESKYGMKYPVKAVLQLPENEYETYKDAVNRKSFTFKGKLLKLEAMMREVYLSEGTITGEKS